MTSQERSLRDAHATPEPPNEPKAEGGQEHTQQQRSKWWIIGWALLTLVIVIAAGFAITLAAGRVPEDRGRDVPPATETSSILGPAGDNSNG
jgi:fatty acid desaturase